MLRALIVLCFAGLASLPCQAQDSGKASEKPPSSAPAESAPKKSYQLSFVVQEVENDRVINSRSYSIIQRNNRSRGSVRAGEKVPFASTTGANPVWQQIDIGVNLDTYHLEEVGDQISLDITVEISSLVESRGDNGPPPSQPIIRNNRWESTVLLSLKRPTVLFESDDPASKRKMRVQLTVTPLR